MTRRRYTINRRTALAGIGTTAVAALGTPFLLSESASAQVTMGELQIPDEKYEDEDGQLYAPWIQIDGKFRYEVQNSPSEWRVYLLVGNGADSWSALDMVDGNISATSGEGNYSVLGDITNSSHWDSSDFTVETEGDSKTVSVPVAILFHVRDSGGSVLAEDSVQDTADILIQHSEKPTAVGGEGQIKFQNDSDSSTPSL